MNGDGDDDIIEISTIHPRREERVVDLALSPGDSPHMSHIDSLAITPPHVRRRRTKLDKKTYTPISDFNDGKDSGRLTPNPSSMRRNRAEQRGSNISSIQAISQTRSGDIVSAHDVILSSQEDELISADNWIDTRNSDGDRWIIPRSYGFQSPRGAQAARQRQQEAQKLRSAARTTPSAVPIPGSYPTLSLSASQRGASQHHSDRASLDMHRLLTQDSTAHESSAPLTSSAAVLPIATVGLACANPHTAPRGTSTTVPTSTSPSGSATSTSPSTPRKRSRPASAYSRGRTLDLPRAPAAALETPPRKHVAPAAAGLTRLAQAAPLSTASLTSPRSAGLAAPRAAAPPRRDEVESVTPARAPGLTPVPAHAIGGSDHITAAVVGAAAGQATGGLPPEGARNAHAQGTSPVAPSLAPVSFPNANYTSPPCRPDPALALAQALGAALAPAHATLPSMLAPLFAPDRAHALAPALCPLLTLLTAQCERSERSCPADAHTDSHEKSHNHALAEVEIVRTLVPCSASPAAPASTDSAAVTATAPAPVGSAVEADAEILAAVALERASAALSEADAADAAYEVIELSDAEEQDVEERAHAGVATTRSTAKSASTSLPPRLHTPVSYRGAAPHSPLRGGGRPPRPVPVVEVTRGRARESLRAYSCVQCEQWYRAMHNCSPPRADCEHVRSSRVALVTSSRSSSAAAQARPIRPAKSGLQATSRHRSAYSPPRTPPGYWDIGFGDSQ